MDLNQDEHTALSDIINNSFYEEEDEELEDNFLHDMNYNSFIQEVESQETFSMIHNIISNSFTSMKYFFGHTVRMDPYCNPLKISRKKKYIIIERNEEIAELDNMLMHRLLQFCHSPLTLSFICKFEKQLKKTNNIFNAWMDVLTTKYPIPYGMPEICWNESNTQQLSMLLPDYHNSLVFDRRKFFCCVMDFLRKGFIIQTFNIDYIFANAKHKIKFLDVSSIFIMNEAQANDIRDLLQFCQRKKNNKNIYYKLDELQLASVVDSNILKYLVEYTIAFLSTRDRMNVQQLSITWPQEIFLCSLIFETPHVLALFHCFLTYFHFVIEHCKDLDLDKKTASASAEDDPVRTRKHKVVTAPNASSAIVPTSFPR